MIATEAAVRFGAEFIADSWAEALPLMKAHWDEIEDQSIKFDPDFETYKKLDEMQALRVFTARSESNELLGYCVYFVQMNPLSKSLLQANQNALFIKKGSRGFGKKFIEWCDDLLKKEGINQVFHHVSVLHDYSAILRRLGYKMTYSIYSRRIS